MSASGWHIGQAALATAAERLFRVDEGHDEPDDIVFLEGDEEAVYVYADLSDVHLASAPKAGSEVTIKGLDTDAPELVLPGGALLRGAWEESLGSCLFFSQAPPQGTLRRKPLGTQFVG
ncbi:hypothetical protein WJX81_004009 [Elliptochloris bilobata]|uniref:Transcription factor TFIIIC triple barrel domain-containing protein n=1 Tax=Elliptochloris bilobata TaxID=381761 RepID=A0AAW1R2X8_9CHLO